MALNAMRLVLLRRSPLHRMVQSFTDMNALYTAEPCENVALD